MRRWLPLLCALGCAAGCESSLGPPRKRPLPRPDEVPALRTPGVRSPRIASYKIDASYDASTHRIEATETLTWKNTGASAVTELPFHLYMNGFKNEASVFMISSGGEHRGQTAGGDGAWGWIEVSSIRLGAQELRPQATYLGPDETVLSVPLPAAVEPGATVELALAFTVQLPEVFARTGYKGAFTMVGQWFPKVGVRIGTPGFETWHCPPFHVNTEFFADFGTYDVTLKVPDTHVVAATGVLVAAEDAGDGRRTLRYRAEDVHDFVWMIDPYMEVLTGEARVEDTTVLVRVYHRPAQRAFARRHLAAAIGAVEQFSELFYPYPWSIMTVVDPPPDAGGAAGMEYPTLVTTAGDHAFMREGIRIPEYVTIHEVGHNWFQGILASNEFEEAWLDEGVNEWADGVVMSRLYGEKKSAIDWMGWTSDIFRLRRAIGGDLADIPAPIATAAYAFPDGDAYASATYGKTMLALRTLENTVGRERFGAAMKAYAQTWAFRHPTGHDLLTSLEGSLAQDLDWFWRPTFYGVGAADFALREADCARHHEPRGVFGEGSNRRTVGRRESPDTGSWRCQVTVVNNGTVPVPVDVELRFADGTRERETWDARDGSRWHTFTVLRSQPLVEVDIDPDGHVLLADHVLDDHVRLGQDNRAAWRASARLSFWTHSLMQAVGL